MGALTPLTVAETPTRLMGSGSAPALAVAVDNCVPNTVISVPGANACVLEVTGVPAALDPVRRASGRGSAAVPSIRIKVTPTWPEGDASVSFRGKSAPNVHMQNRRAGQGHVRLPGSGLQGSDLPEGRFGPINESATTRSYGGQLLTGVPRWRERRCIEGKPKIVERSNM